MIRHVEIQPSILIPHHRIMFASLQLESSGHQPRRRALCITIKGQEKVLCVCVCSQGIEVYTVGGLPQVDVGGDLLALRARDLSRVNVGGALLAEEGSRSRLISLLHLLARVAGHGV
jgi:hypothetical protein